ncbi:MAG TPA: hypothetical protein VL501_04295, partial [Pyrinomonadaceae bacterium]|nr:hypothetical protein [Pyrinomonadaceae bacterium]
MKTLLNVRRSRMLGLLLTVALASISASAAAGDLDTSFDPGPILWQGAPFPAFKHAVAIQPDGKVLIGGRFDTVQGVPRVFIARLNSSGTLDTSFNPVLQTFTIGGQADGEVYDVVLQPDGRILVSGYFGVGGQFKTVVRLNSDGSLDPSFSVTTDDGSPNDNLIYRMLLQPDGKIVIASNALNSVNGVTTNRVARLTSTGALDTALGVTGNVTYGVFALALQSDGKILVGGSGGVISRLNPDGTEDPDWPYPNIGSSPVDSLAVESDGQILVGSRSRLTVNGTLTDGLIRLNPNGTFDLSFNPPDVRTA